MVGGQNERRGEENVELNLLSVTAPSPPVNAPGGLGFKGLMPFRTELLAVSCSKSPRG